MKLISYKDIQKTESYHNLIRTGIITVNNILEEYIFIKLNEIEDEDFCQTVDEVEMFIYNSKPFVNLMKSDIITRLESILHACENYPHLVKHAVSEFRKEYEYYINDITEHFDIHLN